MSKQPNTLKTEQHTVIQRDIASLIPYARNARTHSDAQVAQIAASIKEFGFNNPILTHGDGVVAGHGRLLAARKLGLATVPAIDLSHLTATQARAYVLADNQLAMNAGWDAEMLALELVELKAEGVDLDLLGFPDVAALLAPPPAGGLKPGVDPDVVPDAPKVAVTKLGDVITLGRHRLMCGDATSIDAVQVLGGGQMFDMVWTDPPYNIAYEGGSKKREMIKNDKMEDFYSFLKAAYDCAFASMRPGASIYVTHADTERVNFTRAFVEAGFHLSSVIIWAKNNATFGRQDYFWKHEPMLYGWHSGGAHEWFGPNTEDTVWQIDRPARSEEHPTMKLVELIERALLNSSKPGQTVLDLFGGSGSTMIAAEKTGRTAYLMELDPIYCDVIVTRWEQATGQKAVRP